MIDVVDVVVVLGICFGVLLGGREGLSLALWGFGGMLVGTAVGLGAVPLLLGHLPLSIWVSLGAVLVVAVCGLTVRAAALALHRRVRGGSRWHLPPRTARLAGAGFGGAVAVGLSWMVGLALAGSSLPGVAAAANESRALALLDRADLPLSHQLLHRFEQLGDRYAFPRYVDVFTAEDIRPVPPGPRSIVRDPDVVAASRSTWRVVSRDSEVTAREGTAFAVAPGRLLTAAHVVDRSRSVSVGDGDGSRPATVVWCDPEHDVAVLAVQGRTGEPLHLAAASPDHVAATIGYPGNGPRTIGPARVRDVQQWQAADIRGEGRYEQQAVLIRARVRGGSSGGPLVDAAGRVLGVVVASSRADDETGYAVTGAVVERALAVARDASADDEAGCG